MQPSSNHRAEICSWTANVTRYANDTLESSEEFASFSRHLEYCVICAESWSKEIEDHDGWRDIQRRIATINKQSNEESEINSSLKRILNSVCKNVCHNSSTPKLHGFVLIEEIGRGASSTVYRAQQETPFREVALKLLHSRYSDEAHQQQRFRVEIDALAQLNHPNIVPILEVGQSDTSIFFTMPLIEGGTLAHRLDGTPWNPDAAATLMRDVASAIEFAHHAGIVHRDLKPGNILLKVQVDQKDNVGLTECERWVPLVTDFGVAKPIEGRTLTRTGELIGTPSYMAPEQIKGVASELGPAVDVYALGINLYELLTGRSPFKAESTTQTLLEVVNEDPLPPRKINQRIPRDLENDLFARD